MPGELRRTVGTSLFALMLMALLNPTASLVRHTQPLASPAYLAASRPRILAVSPLAASRSRHLVQPPRRNSRRRPRPAWCGLDRETSWTTAQGRASWERGGVHDISDSPAHDVEMGQAVDSRAEPPAPPQALTHEQLPDESIYLLDGTSMLFRAFYGRGAGGYLAANGATEVGAVLAMGIEFAQFINEVKPRYVAMAFDVGRETTFRREIFPAYKAQRKPVPMDLTLQIPLARALAEALGCRTFAMEGFEADDVMATLARWARSAGLGVVVCSSDKDMCQLVRDRVHVMLPRSNGYSIFGDDEVHTKFGVKPESLPDLFGLVGDAADNIPGVKGIGPKGGSRLLEKFGNLEGIFAGLEGVGGMKIRGSKGMQGLLSQPGVQEEAFLYRDIATLHDEVPLEGVEDFRSSLFLYKGAPPEAEGVMKALGFSAPLRMIRDGPAAPATAKAPSVMPDS